jgi:hypothetical protein
MSHKIAAFTPLSVRLAYFPMYQVYTKDRCGSTIRWSGKKYATAVTRPPCNEDCWTSATMHMQKLATAIVRRVYLLIHKLSRQARALSAYN